jgi:hypothetical protein
LLHIIAEQGPLTQHALLAHCRELLNMQDVPILRELEWDSEAGLEKRVMCALERLGEQGLVTISDVLKVTETGRTYADADV